MPSATTPSATVEGVIFSVKDTTTNETLWQFATTAGAQTYLDEVQTLVDADSVAMGRFEVVEAEPQGPTLTISLLIDNTYEYYDNVRTRVIDGVIPVPPTDKESDEYDEWRQVYIIDWSGVGHSDGNSWYDVEVIACSDPALVGQKFNWGYQQ